MNMIEHDAIRAVVWEIYILNEILLAMVALVHSTVSPVHAPLAHAHSSVSTLNVLAWCIQ